MATSSQTLVSTAPLDIPLGATVFAGFQFSDQDVNPWASRRSRSLSQSGAGKHLCIVIGKERTGILVVGTATFGGKSRARLGTGTPLKLSDVFEEEFLQFWIPVSPAIHEVGMKHQPIVRSTIKPGPLIPVWINIRNKQFLEGDEFFVSTEAYDLSAVNLIRSALELDPLTEEVTEV